MKRIPTILTVFALCALLLTLAACSGKQAPETPDTSSSSTDPAETPAETPDEAPDEAPAETPDEAPAEESPAEEEALTDEEILELVAPYLEDLVYQDPALYPSQNDFLMANLGLDETNVSAATLYMGAPNQNTGYFLMLTPTEDADKATILDKLESQGEAMANTAAQGYTQGYAEYSVIESAGRIFLVMQADAGDYNDLVALLSQL